jgi:1,4-alpha-glucan branching enzyme
LPLSHDEVVHLKKSLLSKMPGDRWKMHANLRALYGYMWAHPGKKLLFMGGEIGQWTEWNEAVGLDWERLEEKDHEGLRRLVRDLNAFYVRHPALYEIDDRPEGFAWIDANDAIQSVVSFIRFAAPKPAPLAEAPEPPAGPEPETETKGKDALLPLQSLSLPSARSSKPKKKGAHVIFVGNFTPVPRYEYRIGVPRMCRYIEAINTDAVDYGGSGVGNLGAVEAEAVPCHGYPQSIVLALPPLADLFLVPELDEDPPEVASPEIAAPEVASPDVALPDAVTTEPPSPLADPKPL